MNGEMLKGGEFLLVETDCENVFTPEDFSDEQKQIAETTEQFVEQEILSRVEDFEIINRDLMKEYMVKCGELGLLMVDAPEAFGGLELDKVTTLLVTEKMAPAGSFAVVFSAHSGLGTLPLVYYGTKEQKEKYLPSIISGECITAYALTEPESGSDALAARTSATLSDDGKSYILNGVKQFITNAGYADLIIVFAKVDKEHFTGFLVEPGFEGVSIGPEEKKLGIKGSSTCQVILDNARIPVENLLGEIGKGHKIALNILNMGRFKLGASAVGGGKFVLAEAARYANERKQFGKTIGSFGAIKEKFAQMTADLFTSESLLYRLAGMMDARIGALEKGTEDYYVRYQKCIEQYASECGISKVFCTEANARVVDHVVQIFGGYGFIAEYPAERFYRDERIHRIWEGTNEINRMLITGMILRKSMKGELPLQSEAMKAFDALMTPSMEEIDDAIPFSREKALIKSMKTVFLIIAAVAAQKYMDTLADEQEILCSSSDIAIQIFALESAVLRCEKVFKKANDRKKELLAAMVKVCAFNASEELGRAARQAAFYVEEGDTLSMILSGIRRFAKYDATGLLQAKRTLADAVLEAKRYVF